MLNLTDKLQLVGRYTLLRSDGANGVRLATYENTIVTGRGDRYHEVYGGVNYYFYEHKLKLQSGVQFADMNNRASDHGAIPARPGRPASGSAGKCSADPTATYRNRHRVAATTIGAAEIGQAPRDPT